MGKGIGILVTIVLIAIGVCMKIGRRSDAGAEVRAQMQALIETMPEYSANVEYLDELFERKHVKAFEEAYSMGGRRTRSKFDWETYGKTVLETMASQSGKDRKPELAKALRTLKDRLFEAEKEKGASGESGG